MYYPFGQDITYTLTPMVESADLASIPAQTIYGYVFSQQPTPSQVLNGTGYISGGNFTGTWVAGASAVTVTIPAIDDPDQNSTVEYRDYWLGFKYKLQTGEQDQYEIRNIRLTRPVLESEDIVVTVRDLETIYAGVTTYCDSVTIQTNVTLAKLYLKQRLKAKGLQYQLIHNLADLKLYVQYRALSQLMVSLINSNGQQFQTLYEAYNDTAEKILAGFTAEYDGNKDGTPDEKQSATDYAIIIR